MLMIRKTTPNDMDALAAAFVAAFSDGEVNLHMTEERFLKMMRRNGFTHDYSYIALDDTRIVGFLLNACRTDETGKLRLYDTGTGVISAYRGRGIAARLFEAMLSDVKETHGTYQLEVLENNLPARSVYEKAGFETKRELISLRCSTAQLPSRVDPDKFTLAEITLDENAVLSDAMRSLLAAGKPSWQNELSSLLRAGGHTLLALTEGGTVKAIMTVAIGSGDIAEIAIAPDADAERTMRLLMSQLRARTRAKTLKVFNLDGDAKQAENALHKLGFAEFARQYEMLRML